MSVTNPINLTKTAGRDNLNDRAAHALFLALQALHPKLNHFGLSYFIRFTDATPTQPGVAVRLKWVLPDNTGRKRSECEPSYLMLTDIDVEWKVRTAGFLRDTWRSERIDHKLTEPVDVTKACREIVEELMERQTDLEEFNKEQADRNALTKLALALNALLPPPALPGSKEY